MVKSFYDENLSGFLEERFGGNVNIDNKLNDQVLDNFFMYIKNKLVLSVVYKYIRIMKKGSVC